MGNIQDLEEAFKMAWTSPTTINATRGLDSFLPYISEVTNFWFGRMLMIALFFIFLMGYLNVKKEDYIGGFAIASYVCFVIGLIFWVIGLVSGLDFGITIGISAISSVLLLMQKKEY